MKVLDLQKHFPDKMVSIDLADRAFNFSPRQREILSATEISPRELWILRNSERGLLVPFSGACLEELSKVTFEQIGDSDKRSVTSIRKVATRLANQERQQFLEYGWSDGAVHGINPSQATATANFDAFLKERQQHEILDNQESSNRSTFLLGTAGISPRDPVMHTRSAPSWLLLLAEDGIECSEARGVRLNELIACAMAAAVVGTKLRERLGASQPVPLTVLRQLHTTDDTGRIFPAWRTRVESINGADSYVSTHVLVKGKPVPMVAPERVGDIWPNDYFRTQDATRAGNWLGVGCTQGYGTLIIHGDTYIPAPPPLAKIIPLSQGGEY